MQLFTWFTRGVCMGAATIWPLGEVRIFHFSGHRSCTVTSCRSTRTIHYVTTYNRPSSHTTGWTSNVKQRGARTLMLYRVTLKYCSQLSQSSRAAIFTSKPPKICHNRIDLYWRVARPTFTIFPTHRLEDYTLIVCRWKPMNPFSP